MSKLTIKACDIPNFGTSENRLNDGGWEVALIGGTHRDCEAIHVSNQDEILERLSEVDPDQEAHDVMHCGHWAVGWYDHIIVDPEHSGVMKVLESAKAEIEDYASLSDDRLSQLEYDRHFTEGCCTHDCPFEHCKSCGDALEGEGKEKCTRCDLNETEWGDE